MSIRRILENDSEINLFEELLNLLSSYADQYPASGADGMLEDLRTNKNSVLPKDALAKDILVYAITSGSSPAGAYQNLTNMRFADLPMSLRPVYLDEEANQEKVANWAQGEKVSDKIIAMLDFKKLGDVKGFTCHCGEKVKLISKEGKK